MTTHHMLVDIETYSDVDIKKAGLYKYAQSPAFDILLIAWAVDNGPVRIVDLTIDPGAEGAGREFQSLMDFYQDLYDPANVLHAYNAAFEHFCINTWLERQGRAPIPLSRWHCTMAHASYCGYPGSLAMVGEAIGLPEDQQKMAVGKALIRKFCCPPRATARRASAGFGPAQPMSTALSPAKPDAPARTDAMTYVRRLKAAEPEKWELFKTYCRQDVATEREIERRLSRWPMPEREQQLWELTTESNLTGVGVDLALVDGAIEVGETEQQELLAEAREITGLDNPKSTQQLRAWLNKEMDEEVTDLRKTTVAELLDVLRDSPERPTEGRAEGPDTGCPCPETRGQAEGDARGAVARMLEIRQLISKTSTKKYDALKASACSDARVRGMMAYYGASRTGRWAGRIVQPQNLPQNHLDGLGDARELVKDRDLEMLRLCWGNIPDTLSQLIRTAFIPAPGKLYAVADYSAIEARVVAWLAGENWVLEAFRRGEDIYCATASQMFNVPVQKHGENAHLRQRGKVAVLALGYGGGEGALTAMGAVRMGIPESDLPEIKAKWRAANKRICQLWSKAEDAALAAVQNGGPTVIPIWGTGQRIVFRAEADKASGQKFLTIELPTHRKLFYAQPFLAPAKNLPNKDSLHYYSTNQQTRKWGATDTWGGKLVENITQAVARDCIAETLLTLRAMNRNPVFHVHDEVICEVDDASELDTILDIMARPIEWAPGLPLKGAGFVCEFYQKD